MSRLSRLVEAKKRRLAEADYKALGDFRRANPADAPKLFQRVQKASKTLHKRLGDALNKLSSDERELKMALVGLKQAISKWGGASPEMVAPLSMEIFALLGAQGDQIDYSALMKLLRQYNKSNELDFGAQRVSS